MAKQVLSQIKAAEEAAKEKRRIALLSAKDSLKLAEQENSEIMDRELSDARRIVAEQVNNAQAQAKAELDALQEKRTQECEAMKQKAQKRLETAANVVIERIQR